MNTVERMSPWEVEGSEYRQPLYQTLAISGYLDPARTKRSIAFLGSKGMGKTMLLREKNDSLRNSTDGWSPTIFPRDAFREVIDPNTWGIYKEERDLILDPEYWCELWLSAIVTVAAYHEDKPIPPSIAHLFPIAYPPQSVLSVLSRWFADPIRKRVRQIRAKLAVEVTETMASIEQDYCFFLDDVDEVSTTQKKNAAHQWRVTQRGLLLAMYKLSKRTKRIRVITTLRPQALNWSSQIEASPELNVQLRGLVAPLEYSQTDLFEIFRAHCEATERRHWGKPYEKDPVHGFLGRSEIQLKYGAEHALHYIWRHTLGRPRELISIGRDLLDAKRYDDETFVKIVNNAGSTFFDSYISETFKGQAHSIHFGFSVISSNLVYPHELELIDEIVKSQKFPGEAESVRRWSAQMVAAGLIGYPKINTGNAVRLHFERAGLHTFPDEALVLPKADFYVIHPCAYHFMRNNRPTLASMTVDLPGVHEDMEIGLQHCRLGAIRVSIMGDYLHIHRRAESETIDLRNLSPAGFLTAATLLLLARSGGARETAIIDTMNRLSLASGRTLDSAALWKKGTERGDSGTFSNNGVLKAARIALEKIGVQLSAKQDSLMVADRDGNGISHSDIECLSLELLMLRAESWDPISLEA